MVIGGVAYAGGWSWWRFDCVAQTADRLDFASLKADGTEGPITPEKGSPYAIAPGGDAAELAAVACSREPRTADALSTADAVRIGRVLGRDHDDRATTRCDFLKVRRGFVENIVQGGQSDGRGFFVNQGDGAVLQFAGGITLGMDVADLLQLQRALHGQGEHGAPAEEEDVRGLG